MAIEKWLDYFPLTTAIMIGILALFGRNQYDFNVITDSYVVMIIRNHLDEIFFLLKCGALCGAIIIPAALGAFYITKMLRKRYEDLENHAAVIKMERETLLNLFESTAGLQWRDRTRWGTSEPHRTWYGVKTSHDSGRIIKLILPENNLTGTLPAGFFEYLTELNELDLRSNYITGELSQDICRCRKLAGIYLHENFFTGRIPLNIGRLPQLGGIYLFSNKFENVTEAEEQIKKDVKDGCHVYI